MSTQQTAQQLDVLRKRLAQYDKMKSYQKNYNRRRWSQMKEARGLRDVLTQPQPQS